MQNVIWNTGAGVLPTDLTNCGAASAAYVAANRANWPASWAPVAYDTALPDLPQYCQWSGTALTVNTAAKYADMEAQIGKRVDEMLDTLAQAWQYTDATRIMTYATSTIALYAHQAAAFGAYRDAVWTKLTADVAAFKAGTLTPPASVDAYLATLPAVPAMPVV